MSTWSVPVDFYLRNGFSHHRQDEDRAYYRALADEVDARSIIDVGCGTGLLTRSLARPGRTVIGVDLSRTVLATPAG